MTPAPASVTIAIPTFDRPEALRRCVQCFLDQWSPEFRILVVDNCSARPASEVLADLLVAHPEVDVRIVRNAVNIGGGPNVLRCFELAATDWVWMFGDDDQVCPGALARVVEALRTYPNAVFINFSTNLLELHGIRRPNPIVARSLEEFVNGIDGFSNVLFGSASIHRRDEVWRRVQPYAYGYIRAFAPHLAQVLLRLRVGPAECVFHDARVIVWECAPEQERWNMPLVNRGLFELIGLVEDARLRSVFFAKIQAVHQLPCLARRKMALIAVFGAQDDHDRWRDAFLDGQRIRLQAGQRVLTETIFLLLLQALLRAGAPVLKWPLRLCWRLRYGPDKRIDLRCPSPITIALGERRF